ncbi:hypothetical protein R9C00_19650 [Flammeovirgaceae bacterium SG7u.111]|nr:hypothetical protein [Flammeovirgaceae bacterium SG7u.132]WPO33917.1 hypothetical protein R9C00_19650 [Flammeovirgaceae bacterium SG7u.111]
MASLVIDKIRQEVATLGYDEKVELLHVLANELARSTPPQPQSTLLDLDGLGKKSWGNTDPDEYVNKLRDEW